MSDPAKLDQVETPALVLDRRKLEHNLARMQTRAEALGVALRPHMKTAKSRNVARLVGADRITVSTLKEADYFAEAGFTDILYAVGMAPGKVSHAAALCRAGVALSVVTDSVEAAVAIGAKAEAEGVVLPVLVEIDTDGHRAGVKPEEDRLIGVGRAIHASAGLRLAGVMTHAGESYNCTTPEAIIAMAEQERAGAVRAAERLRAAGLQADVVSVGSTPTALFAAALQGVTELRAGVYMFQDLVMAGLGVCRPEEIAVSVLATVIGHQSDKHWIITDGGWMALSRDRGTASQAIDQGYGLVCTEAGDILLDVLVLSANQEHGIIAARPGTAPLDLERFAVGSRVRILPNHACATAAQHGAYLVVEEGADIEAVWPRQNGW
jgi:D-serine deaminase-like pyridoxal phosphate-dependent protein